MRSPFILTLALVAAVASSQAQTDSSGMPAPLPPLTSGIPLANDSSSTMNSSPNDRPMTPPSLLTGSGSSLAFTGEMERSNYLRGGASVTAAYDDNVQGTAGSSSGDESYSIGPFVSIDLARTRLHFNTTYSPGFTFYQHLSSRNQNDQSVALNFSYRLSPHVTFTALDSFAKTSAFSNLSFNTLGGVPNAIQSANLSLIGPVEDTLINAASVGISYQFTRNDMIGVTGNSSILRYVNQNQSPGLYDSTGYGGGGYYTHRFGRNYLGLNYLFQNFQSDPGSIQTRTNSFYGSYTYFFRPNFSLSGFGGAQYSDTFSPQSPSRQMWSPSGGGSLSWQGRDTSFAASYSHRITDGGGLPGSVTANTAEASFRAQFTKTVTATVGADYSTNNVLDPIFQGAFNGHTLSESAGVQKTFGEHFTGSLGYLHLHQSYQNISVISLAPDRNRVWISLSYQFERPLGR